jgi:hypothetical protein
LAFYPFFFTAFFDGTKVVCAFANDDTKTIIEGRINFNIIFFSKVEMLSGLVITVYHLMKL